MSSLEHELMTNWSLNLQVAWAIAKTNRQMTDDLTDTVDGAIQVIDSSIKGNDIESVKTLVRELAGILTMEEMMSDDPSNVVLDTLKTLSEI